MAGGEAVRRAVAACAGEQGGEDERMFNGQQHVGYLDGNGHVIAGAAGIVRPPPYCSVSAVTGRRPGSRP